MTVLVHNAYGKSRVRLTKIQRHTDRHELFEWSIDLQLTGDFAQSYLVGDNRNVIATDTMKNIVYALAADNELSSPEAFAMLLCKHLLDSYSQVVSARVDIHVEPWRRMEFSSRPHPHSFIGGESERRTCHVEESRSFREVTAGITNLLILKTTDSSWRNFHSDQYRTLQDCDDRIFATSLTADWTYSSDVDWDATHATIRQSLLETFANHKSLGVQHTLNAMGEAAIACCSAMSEITLTMPNRHRILVNLTPVGRENKSEVFVATDEPFGLITGTLKRV